jgi:tetratricopeptide (TPR) repeat protein
MSGRRIKLRLSAALVAAGALVALAAWPAYLSGKTQLGSRAAAAVAVKPDWRVRDANIAFLESRAGRVRGDMLTPRMLATEYLQRYRERGDIGDVQRAERAARRSLAAQPRGNVAGEASLAGVLLTLHRFRDAKAAVLRARAWRRDDAGVAAEEAALDLELGDVGGAGHLDEARARVARAMDRADTIYDTPAERRAWLHARSGELALEAGDVAAAGRATDEALAIFPTHLRALTIASRVALASGDLPAAEALAQRAVAIQPNPEVLGLLGDAQSARGETAAAAATRDLLLAIARIGDAFHVNDRLIALWEADHRIRVDHAYGIARRDLAVRDDIYAEDALAWTAARSGRWAIARGSIAKALRYGTQDPAILRHAAEIAAHLDASATQVSSRK